MKLFKKLAVLCMALTLCVGVGATMTACGGGNGDGTSSEAPFTNGYRFRVVNQDGSPATGYQVQICIAGNASACLAPAKVDANGYVNYVVEDKTQAYEIHLLDANYEAVENFESLETIPANYNGGVIVITLK